MSNILEIKVDNKIVSNPDDIAETINEHFPINEDVPAVEVDPEFYLETTDKSFSLQTPSVDKSILTGIYPSELKTAK